MGCGDHATESDESRRVKGEGEIEWLGDRWSHSVVEESVEAD